MLPVLVLIGAAVVARSVDDETPSVSASSSTATPTIVTTAATTADGSATVTTASPGDRCVEGDVERITVSELPDEAIATLILIEDGGPFPYAQDGATFQNREGRLPDHARGYYLEYTVETPGSGDRGARRIVVGECGDRWYTDDHYDSFALIEGEP